MEFKENFKKYKLKELSDISSSKRIFASEYKEKGIPFYRSKEIIEKQSNKRISNKLFISKERYIEIKNKYGVPSCGDLLLTSVGTLGVPYLVKNEEFYFKDGNLTWFRNLKQINKSYLYYWFFSPEAKYQITSKQIGSTQKALTISNLNDFEILIPTRAIQEKIVTILKSLDSKIEINNKIISNLESQAQAIFKSWFVDFEPFQDGNFVESELGMIPEGWEVKELGEIINLYDNKRVPISKMDRDKMEKNYPYYGANGIIDYVDNYLFDGKYLLMGEDGTVRTEEGFPILNYVDEKFWVSNHAHIMRGTLVSTEYIYLLLSKMFINNIVTGAVQEKINQRNLKKIKIIFPEKKELESFEKIIEPMFKMKLYLNNQNTKLAELRDALLPKLMAGEIDVSNIKIEGEEVKNE